MTASALGIYCMVQMEKTYGENPFNTTDDNRQEEEGG
jgi:hypothetical protein